MLDLRNELEKYYGFSNFRTGQKEIIEDVLAGRDVLGILPTGSGKSICYQLPARVLPGTVVVISPLISLMLDQVKQLKASGFKDVIAFNSFMNSAEKERELDQLATYRLVYVSPEMLQNESFINELKKCEISLFVVDEAHCISQWGHEFRPDYLKLHETIKQLNNPPILALSATATPEVQADIEQQLHSVHMVKHVYPMDRKNISFVVESCQDEQAKKDYLVQLLQKFPVPSMIYFSSRKGAEKIAHDLMRELPELRIAFYHGGMEQTDRILIQQQFMNNQLDVICCTSAFGMGIDKQDIRLVVHFHLPTQIESFIQELGRAGRDGKSSVSLVLTAPNDDYLPKVLLEGELPKEEDINRLFHHLGDEKEVVLPFMELEQKGWLNEIQLRFLEYQLEKHSMLKNGRILYNLNKWNKVKQEIIQVIQSRQIYKQKKLTQLLEWITDHGCRRRSLFSSFQKGIQEPTFYCCDHCDFTFDAWSPKYEERLNQSLDWKARLKKILHQV
ncbi:RecQ family ATP-dependent DNA helicase [Radiobacillus kanasensis]|uniref:RecQ family ATP-dependent DNA helicase n=1 Tax=Radiobacillus kanasensis TaxID=2844358 RepID=UPI001E44D8F9|nr:RecQ family ATP-dependent DNA helicase [Radiobacillus kanasensis]UFT97656.1 RecQ family ATP-dependent DNA helicase [Radiobacillus kanasensis]